LKPIEEWCKEDSSKIQHSEISNQIYRLLGKKNETKIFLASLLVSLLKSQGFSAKEKEIRKNQ